MSKNEVKKSNYGPKGAKMYNLADNVGRKANNTGDTAGDGPNQNVKSYSTKPGQLSAKQQAALLHSKRNIKANSEPVTKPTLSPEEVERYKKNMKKEEDEMLEVTPDGKQERVEGKEPLKLSARWKALKKALDHQKAFMDLEEEMEGEPEEQQAQGQPMAPEEAAMQQAAGGMPPQEGEPQPSEEEGQQQMVPEQDGSEQPPEEAPTPQEDEGQQEMPPEGGEADSEAVSAAPEDQGEEGQEMPEDGNGGAEPDEQELIDALKEEGYSDQEIAYVVHGQHAPDVDESKAAKAEATRAMSEIDIQNAMKQASLEHNHQAQSLADEREHKKRMQDLEFQAAQKKHALLDQDAAHRQRMSDVEYQQAQQANPQALEQEHKKRMLDIEYEKAKKEAMAPDGTEGDAEVNKQMKQLEVEKKKLELKLRAEEMKLELEFKKREHELKLKMMEQQIKEQAKQKGEISSIKHEQKLAEVKQPPEKKKTKSGESLKKNRPTPVFPGLGLPDNRRETAIVDTPDEVRRKVQSIAYQQLAGHKHSLDDVSRFREGTVGPGVRDEKGRRKMGMLSPGLATNVNVNQPLPGTAGYAMGRNSLNDNLDIMYTPEQVANLSPNEQATYEQWRKEAADPGFVNATQQHEDFHLMMNRVQHEHGLTPAEKAAISHNMWNFLLHSTPDGHSVNEMTEALHPGAKENPEEKPAMLISYLNTKHMRNAYSGFVGTPYAEKTTAAAKKMYSNFRNLAANMTPEHIANWRIPGHVTPQYVKDNSHLLKPVKGPAQQAPKGKPVKRPIKQANVEPVVKSEDDND